MHDITVYRTIYKHWELLYREVDVLMWTGGLEGSGNEIQCSVLSNIVVTGVGH